MGGGAGGFTAALAAARLGVRTLLIEREPRLGGTQTSAGVSTWEVGAGGTGIAWDVHNELLKMPGATGIATLVHHCCHPTGPRVFPGALALLDPSLSYEASLRRWGTGGLTDDFERAQALWHPVSNEPAALEAVFARLLHQAGCAVWTDSEVVEVKWQRDELTEVGVMRVGERLRVAADYFVDATADAALAELAGCELRRGAESRETFGEPDAPEQASLERNAVTLMYRVSADRTRWLEPPPEIPRECRWREHFPVASIVEFPAGDLQVNMLPTLEGAEWEALGEAAREQALLRAWAHWRWTQRAWPEFERLEPVWFAPRLGVRGGPRVAGEYTLTEKDLLAGLSNQPHEDVVALSDQPVDLHGRTSCRGTGELAEPYGVPFRCLAPLGVENLLVACRGASFSHLAASSCRLTRTMMQLGQAAGTAAVIALEAHALPREVSPAHLRQALAEQGVILDWRDLPGAED